MAGGTPYRDPFVPASPFLQAGFTSQQQQQHHHNHNQRLFHPHSRQASASSSAAQAAAAGPSSTAAAAANKPPSSSINMTEGTFTSYPDTLQAYLANGPPSDAQAREFFAGLIATDGTGPDGSSSLGQGQGQGQGPPHGPPPPSASSSSAAQAAAVEDGTAGEAGEKSKRRRVLRACDVCRKKKIRCDFGVYPDREKCSNCSAYGHECTFVDAAKKRTPPKGYVDALEARMERMEHLLVSLAPGVDFTEKVGKPVSRDDDPSTFVTGTDGAAGAFGGQPSPASLEPSQRLMRGFCDDLSYPDAHSRSASMSQVSDSEDELDFVTEKIAGVHVQGDPGEPPTPGHYVGKSSGYRLIKQLEQLSAPESVDGSIFASAARPEFWATSSFPLTDLDCPEQPYSEPEWPAEDLAESLIDIYFQRCHPLMPVLHRPTFLRDWRNEEKRRKSSFAMVAFSVFALASRYTDDPRVLASPDDKLKHSAGVKFLMETRKINMRGMPLFMYPTIPSLQFMVIASVFLMFLPSSTAFAWAITGIAMRILQDAGMHRKASKKMAITPFEYEMRKRIFWCLYVLDRKLSAGLGRPMCIQDEDFDIELPVEVDDDYLDNPVDGKFVQPPGKPARIATFICLVRLLQILGRTLRTIYAINKAKAIRGFTGPHWDQFIVAELDSAVNAWLDSVPEHLKYRADHPDDVILSDSSELYAQYYMLQVFIHRPFIPSPKKPSPLNFPSLAICTNAARSTAHVCDNLRKRKLLLFSQPDFLFQAFHAACMLMLNIWGAKKSGVNPSPSAMGDVTKCIKVLEEFEDRFQIAGKCHDVLSKLAELCEVPMPPRAEHHGVKREREEDDVSESPNTSAPGDSPAGSSASGGRKVTAKPSRRGGGGGGGGSRPSTSRVVPLPFNTADLAATSAFSSDSSPKTGRSTSSSMSAPSAAGGGPSDTSASLIPPVTPEHQAGQQSFAPNPLHGQGRQAHMQAPVFAVGPVPNGFGDMYNISGFGLSADGSTALMAGSETFIPSISDSSAAMAHMFPPSQSQNVPQAGQGQAGAGVEEGVNGEGEFLSNFWPPSLLDLDDWAASLNSMNAMGNTAPQQ